MESPLPGRVKAGIQPLTGVAALRQPRPVQPQHHPLIGLRRVDDGLVDETVLHQQYVPGLEKVGDALHHVGDLAAQGQNQLVELVVVVVQLLGPGILQMEQAEALVQIAPLADLTDIQHSTHPLFSRLILPHILPFYNPNYTQNHENISAFFVEKAVEFGLHICYTTNDKKKGGCRHELRRYPFH